MAQLQDTTQREAILQWLSPIDYEEQHRKHIQLSSPETGQGFLRSSKYKKWSEEPNQILYCSGGPGVGKTILSSIIIADLQSRYSDRKDVGIAYIFCNFYSDSKQTTSTLLASLLAQLVQRLQGLPTFVKDLYEQWLSSRMYPSVKCLEAMILAVCNDMSRSYIIVDGLDEIGREKFRFLRTIFKLHDSSNLSILATSRPLPDISRAFLEYPTVETAFNDTSIYDFVKEKSLSLPSFVTENPQLREQIVSTITEQSNGSFLSASLQLQSLLEARSAVQVRDILQRLDGGINNVYNHIMGGITSKPPEDIILAERILSWVTFAGKKLTVQELQHAVSVEIGSPELDPQMIIHPDDALSICDGLIVIHEQEVNLVHSSARQYLEQNEVGLNTNANALIATTCISYLSLNAFNTGMCPSDGLYEDRLAQYPLYEFAAQNWGSFAQGLPVDDQVLGFLATDTKVAACSQALFGKKENAGYSQIIPLQVTGMHLAAYFGLAEVVAALLRQGTWANSRDNNGKTPLWWALERQQKPVIEVLIAHDTWTLRWLIDKQEVDLIRCLLSFGYSVNILDSWKRSPLHHAVLADDEHIVSCLIDSGADLSLRDMYGTTPLQLAVQFSHESLFSLLLKRGANPGEIDIGILRKIYRCEPSDALLISERYGSELSIVSLDVAVRQSINFGDMNTKHLILLPDMEYWHIFGSSNSAVVQWDLDIERTQHESDLRIEYTFTVWIPSKAGESALPAKKGHKISWTIEWSSDQDSHECWRSKRFMSTLPCASIPRNGLELLAKLLDDMKNKWTTCCDMEKAGLRRRRLEIFKAQGKNDALLDGLLEDAERWMTLRGCLQRQVITVKAFAKDYTSLELGDGELVDITSCTDSLLIDISARIQELDLMSKDLIQIEFNLVSINESRLSRTNAASMKRLSWVTSLFGMNVNILEDNPDWRWYILFVGCLLPLTITAWLILKYNPGIEHWADSQASRVFERASRTGNNQDAIVELLP